MSTKAFAIIGALVVVAIGAGVVLMMSDHEDHDDAEASEIDGAFLTGMKPHHESAIEMAEMAQERADHPEINKLAGEIIAAQANEIEILDGIHRRLYGDSIGQMSHGTLGLSEDQMGMDMDMEMLETAKPFDREFIDMMVPHHQGAIRMARVELAQGSDSETKSLAAAIITAQSTEIEQMNDWRTEWYGAPSPAGGVPTEDEVVPPAEGDGMSGIEH